MTGNTDKIRAVVLAALMVLSVFAGTLAFAGSASAASGASVDFFSPTQVDEGSTGNKHNLNVSFTGVSTDGTDENLTITLPDGLNATGQGLSIENASGSPGNSETFSVNDPDGDGVNEEITVSFQEATSTVYLNGTITVDVTVNNVNSDTDGNINFNLEDSGGSNVAASQTVTILNTDDSGPGAPTLESAVHYDNDTSSNGVDSEIELAFSENISNPSTIEVYNDDSPITPNSITQTSSGRVLIELGSSQSDILTGDVQVNLDGVQDQQGTTTSDDGNNSVTFAPVPVKFGSSVNAYQGGNVAIINGTTDASVEIDGANNDYFFDGSTGANSKVFVFNTSNRALGDYNISIAGSDAADTQVTVRNLGFQASVADLSVTTDDTIEVDVSANAGNRRVEATLLDSNGNEINSTTVTTAGGGTATIEFNTATADDNEAIDTGNYTVEVTDLFSGITVESSTITVSEAGDVDANFASNLISEQRGDILGITVELSQTDTATLSFGSESDGVIANATVEDGNDDNQVTVYLNTYEMTTSTSGQIFSVDSDSDDEILKQNSPTETSNLIDAGDYDLEVQAGDQGVGTGVTNSDDVATVTLEERSTENIRMWTASKGQISSFSELEDVNEALSEGTLTQSSEIAVGDYAVHQLQASGFEGFLDARENEEVTSEFLNLVTGGPADLTIEEANPGANQDAAELNLTSSAVSVVADGENDTYYVVLDTAQAGFGAPRNESLPDDEDTTLETNFTVLSDDGAGDDFAPESLDDDEQSETTVQFTAAQPEVTINTPYNVSQASGQTFSGTTNIAPGTELSLRVRSQSGVSPSFLKTASPTVQSDGTFSATFDFSGQSVGDEYDIIANDELLDESVEESGQVVEAVATDTATPTTDTATPEPETDTATPEPETDTATATPEPETDTATPMPETDTPTSTPTSTPGFGVVVALTALLAAALLAIRRD